MVATTPQQRTRSPGRVFQGLALGLQEIKRCDKCQDHHAGRPALRLGWPGERKSIGATSRSKCRFSKSPGEHLAQRNQLVQQVWSRFRGWAAPCRGLGPGRTGAWGPAWGPGPQGAWGPGPRAGWGLDTKTESRNQFFAGEGVGVS